MQNFPSQNKDLKNTPWRQVKIACQTPNNNNDRIGKCTFFSSILKKNIKNYHPSFIYVLFNRFLTIIYLYSFDVFTEIFTYYIVFYNLLELLLYNREWEVSLQLWYNTIQPPFEQPPQLSVFCYCSKFSSTKTNFFCKCVVKFTNYLTTKVSN